MKRILSYIMSTVVIITMIFQLSSCGKKKETVEQAEITTLNKISEEETDEVTDDLSVEEEIQSEDDDDIFFEDYEEEPTKPDKGFTPRKADNWKTAYRYFLNDFIDYIEKINESPSEGEYWIDYLNDDDVPELFVSTGTYHASGVKVVLYNPKTHDLKVYPEDDDSFSYSGYGAYGTVCYQRRTGKVFSVDAHMGSRMTSVYDFSNGKEKFIWSGHAVYPEYTIVAGVPEVYQIGNENISDTITVSKAEYEKQFKKYVPTELIKAPVDLSECTWYKKDSDGRSYYCDEEGYSLPKNYKQYANENTFKLTKDNIKF